MNVVTIRVKGRRGVTRLPTRVDRPVQVPYSPPAPIVAPAPSCLGGAKPLKLPGWWLAVVRAREVSGLPLLGLPASQSDPVRPLAVPSAKREALAAAGLAPEAVENELIPVDNWAAFAAVHAGVPRRTVRGRGPVHGRGRWANCPRAACRRRAPRSDVPVQPEEVTDAEEEADQHHAAALDVHARRRGEEPARLA